MAVGKKQHDPNFRMWKTGKVLPVFKTEGETETKNSHNLKTNVRREEKFAATLNWGL